MLNKVKRFTLLGLLVAGTTLAFTGCGTTSQQNTQTAQAIAGAKHLMALLQTSP